MTPNGRTKKGSARYLLVSDISTPRSIILALDPKPSGSRPRKASRSTVDPASTSTGTIEEATALPLLDALFSTGDPVISSGSSGPREFAPSVSSPDGETASTPDGV